MYASIHLPQYSVLVIAMTLIISCGNPAVAQQTKLTLTDNGKSIVAKAGGQTMFRYRHQTVKPPRKISSIYQRSGYIHPIYTPSGKMVTDDFSDDHAHQHGLFFAFVKASVQDTVVDFWNQASRKGAVKHHRLIHLDTHKATFQVLLHHIQFMGERSEKPERLVFEETWTVRCGQASDCFLIDLQSDLKNVTKQTVKILKNHYGSFGIRGSGVWRKPAASGFDFMTSHGKNRGNGNLHKANWVAMLGTIDQKPCGVAVIGHSGNFRSPQPARLHPTMPYFSFAPMANSGFDLKPGENYRSVFRIVSFDGKPDSNQLDQLSSFSPPGLALPDEKK